MQLFSTTRHQQCYKANMCFVTSKTTTLAGSALKYLA